MKTKSQKREEALMRQEARNQRTARDQIAKLDAGGYRALKERTRLMTYINQFEEVLHEEPSEEKVKATKKKGAKRSQKKGSKKKFKKS